MVAACDLKHAARVGEYALLNVLYPGPVHADRHLVFSLARHRAGVAPDALAVIDDESVFHPRKIDPEKSIILGSIQKGSYLGDAAWREKQDRMERWDSRSGPRMSNERHHIAALDLIIHILDNPLHRFRHRLSAARAFQLTHPFRQLINFRRHRGQGL